MVLMQSLENLQLLVSFDNIELHEYLWFLSVLSYGIVFNFRLTQFFGIFGRYSGIMHRNEACYNGRLWWKDA